MTAILSSFRLGGTPDVAKLSLEYGSDDAGGRHSSGGGAAQGSPNSRMVRLAPSRTLASLVHDIVADEPPERFQQRQEAVLLPASEERVCMSIVFESADRLRVALYVQRVMPALRSITVSP